MLKYPPTEEEEPIERQIVDVLFQLKLDAEDEELGFL